MGCKRGNVLVGAIVGALAVALVAFGNPVNMGICGFVCFIRGYCRKLWVCTGRVWYSTSGRKISVCPRVPGLHPWRVAISGCGAAQLPLPDFILGFLWS